MRAFIALALGVAMSTGAGLAQQPSSAESASRRDSESLPIRLEIGGYGSRVDRGLGYWRGAETQLWIRSNPRFIPAFIVDSQTRPAGTQQNYSFLSYLNWSKSFYTVQGFSVAPQRNDQAVYFPRYRYDIKAFRKLDPVSNVVLGAGFTQFDFGKPGHGQIFNLGALYYRHRLIVEGNLFINRNQPGNLFSGSGSLAAQYGAEGRYWFGVTAGGGRELYRYVGLAPFDVQFSSYSVSVFYRKWISRNFGFVTSFDHQNKLDGYRREGLTSRLFFEF